MSTVEIQLKSMNNKVEGSTAVLENEREEKVIAGFDELLEQEMKGDDSVDCFMKRVEDTSGESSEFSLDYEKEASVVTDSALYSPKEVASTDNSSSLLEKELEITLNKEREVPLKITSDAEKFKSCEEENTRETAVINTDVEVTDQGTKKEHSAEEETKERETAEEVDDSLETKSPSEMQNDTKETEKDSNNQNAQDENSVGVHKDVLFVVFQPQDQVNDKNDGAQNNGNEKMNGKENISRSGNVNINPVSDKPVPTTVFRITCSSEAKNIKEISKPIFIKTARIIKNGSTVTAKTADTFGASGHTSGEDNVTNTTSTELEEKQDNKSADSKDEGTNENIQSDDPTNSQTVKSKVIFTRKVYGNIKKSPKLLQGKQDLSTKDRDPPNVGRQDHHSTDKNADLANGVQISVKTKALVSNEGKTPSDGSAMPGEVGDECVGKRETNFTAVKRKFEEVCRISRQEEEATIEEIKKMKRETLDVLKSIRAEMEKLKIFLAGK